MMEKSCTMRTAGRVLSEGYKVLVFIEDYGGANEVASLY